LVGGAPKPSAWMKESEMLRAAAALLLMML
jgi:hypothetical protein